MSLIIGGRVEPCDCDVRDWHDTGLHYVPGEGPGVTPRMALIDTVVWHWTAAENPPEKVFRNLRRRKLAVEFCLGADGTVYQFADPCVADCHDCGRLWDRRSIGVEIVSYGMSWPASRPWSLLGVPAGGRGREIVMSSLRGQIVYVADLYRAQWLAAVALARALTAALPGLGWDFFCPATILDTVDGAPETRRIIDRPMLPWERRRWRGGHLGHLQITTRGKSDPGVYFLEQLRAAGPSPHP